MVLLFVFMTVIRGHLRSTENAGRSVLQTLETLLGMTVNSGNINYSGNDRNIRSALLYLDVI